MLESWEAKDVIASWHPSFQACGYLLSNVTV
jgi:hypothetical protein